MSQPHMKVERNYCKNKNPQKSQLKQKFDKNFFEKAHNNENNETIYIDSVYVCGYVNDDDKVSPERIRDNHRKMNQVLAGLNTDELNRVPDEFKSVVGIPNIQLKPLDPETLTIHYVKINNYLDSESPVQDAIDTFGDHPGVLDVFICNTQGGNILGQAYLESGCVFVHKSTVGGDTHKGEFSGYDNGKTLLHEIFHAFSLYHVFSDESCDGIKLHDDVPEAIQPNFNAENKIIDGRYQITGDHRSNDRQFGTNDSCLHVDPSGLPEMAINIMDYGEDSMSLVVTDHQVQTMRGYLLDPTENTTLKLLNKDDPSISGTGEIIEGDGGKSSNSTSNTDPILIAVYVIAGVVALIVIFFIGRKLMTKRTKNSDSYMNAKPAVSYATYLTQDIVY